MAVRAAEASDIEYALFTAECAFKCLQDIGDPTFKFSKEASEQVRKIVGIAYAFLPNKTLVAREYFQRGKEAGAHVHFCAEDTIKETYETFALLKDKKGVNLKRIIQLIQQGEWLIGLYASKKEKVKAEEVTHFLTVAIDRLIFAAENAGGRGFGEVVRLNLLAIESAVEKIFNECRQSKKDTAIVEDECKYDQRDVTTQEIKEAISDAKYHLHALLDKNYSHEVILDKAHVKFLENITALASHLRGGLTVIAEEEEHPFP